MTGESIGELAKRLTDVAHTDVPTETASQLVADIETIRDQLAWIVGPDAEIVREAQRLTDASVTAGQALAAIQGKIKATAEHHLGGGGTGGAATGGAKPAPGKSKPHRSWKTVADEAGQVRSYPDYRTAKRQLGSRPGQELHHLVEQSQAKPERSGFSVERINTTDNMVYLPVDVHRRVTASYASKQLRSGMTLRDEMNGLSWDEQYEAGIEAVNDEWQ
jgi:hypothetical protein